MWLVLEAERSHMAIFKQQFTVYQAENALPRALVLKLEEG